MLLKKHKSYFNKNSIKKILIFSYAISVLFFMFSCSGSESDEGNNVHTYLIITSDGGNEKLLGKAFTFRVKDNLSNDVTPNCKLYVNGNLISGNAYTPTEKGIYTVKAEFKDLPINPISINVVVNEGVSFKHRILYEDFTGTWCGYCTIALARRDNLEAQTQDFVFIGIHGPSGTTDPWSNTTSTEMEIFKNVSEWPAMFINRTTVWAYNSNYSDLNVPLNQLSALSKIGIKISSSVSGNILNAETKIFFSQNFSDLKIVAFIVEDDLVHDQKNYISTLYGGGSYIYNYVHHNVLRSRLTSSVVGDIIPGSQTVISNEYSKNFQYTIPSGYHTNNLKVIVMILNANGNVLNVREEKAGINSNYEFL
ncbi:Outer membrane protein Omp28 [Chryseobacterium formosense]|nr:Outer membrane protein Omp28 [Chryseobacterium formosense]